MTELPRNLMPALEANRGASDQSLRTIVTWFMSEPELAQWACQRIVEDFRRTKPMPPRKPSITFV